MGMTRRDFMASSMSAVLPLARLQGTKSKVQGELDNTRPMLSHSHVDSGIYPPRTHLYSFSC